MAGLRYGLNGAEGPDPYMTGFFSRVAENVVNDHSTLWIRSIRTGMLEYATSRLMEWRDDNNISEVRICIASDGGDLDETLALYSLLRSIDKPTVANVFWACSGGVVVALACDVRIGFPTTTILVHDPWVAVEGRSDYISDHIQGIDLKRRIVREIFRTRTKLTARQLNVMARKECWMDAEAAYRCGILTDVFRDLGTENGEDDMEEEEERRPTPPRRPRRRKKNPHTKETAEADVSRAQEG